MALTLSATPILTRNGTFNNLPPEVLLDIIPYIPYSPSNISSLSLTCWGLNTLVIAHEQVLVTAIRKLHFRPRTISLFPGLPKSYKGLRTLHYRLETLEDSHRHWLQIKNHSLELHWLKGRWEQVHKAGLLLLYRVQDTEGYEEKLMLLKQLSGTSLACLLFKLISSIHILRVRGPEPINAGYASGDIMVRSDIELAFEELLLQHGPRFFVVMLEAGKTSGKKEWAVRYASFFSCCSHCPFAYGANLESTHRTLQTEIAGMKSRQLPSPNGMLKPPTLISSLRRALAAKARCEVHQTVAKMWEILSSTGFDDVDEEKMVSIVSGEELERGMKRIF